jgi:hypothetical protein
MQPKQSAEASTVLKPVPYPLVLMNVNKYLQTGTEDGSSGRDSAPVADRPLS